MSIFRIIASLFVGLIVVGFLALLGLQKEPVTVESYFETEILDRRYQGVSVVTGAPQEGEIRVKLSDGRTVWLPALRYFLDETATNACVSRNVGRVSGTVSFRAAKRSDCV